MSNEWKAPPELAGRLKDHVVMLAETIGERNVETPESYKRAADYLAGQLEASGYQVKRQQYVTSDEHLSQNLWVERPGRGPILVVGAHYDSLIGGTPGADDNASGCAAVLELARMLREGDSGPPVRLVLFANEEPPYFQGDDMGSYVYARECQSEGLEILGMISMESIGFYTDDRDSQHFPTGVSGYPDQGNFVAFVGDLSAKPFLESCLRIFKNAGTIHAEGLSAPGLVQGVTWSDHWSFSRCGYPAFMITDTAPFRNPHYHLRTDTPDTLDYRRLAAVVEGTRRVIGGLGPAGPLKP